jgi:phenylalanyl-tRNA synthetase alpha chain
MTDTPDDLKDRIGRLRGEFDRAVAEVREPEGLQSVRDQFLGRKSGAVTALLKSVGGLASEARREAGRELNVLKGELEERLGDLRGRLDAKRRQDALALQRLDMSLPGRLPSQGRRHILSLVREELEDIFVSMGYEIFDGPEVEDDYHCFEALNMPPDHPARDMQDTFYLAEGGGLLRTHTSSGQIRYMLANEHPPDVRIISHGKVYRRDSDVTHTPMFQQIEALVVGTGVSLGDLKGTVEAFLHALFGKQYPVRFRSSFFPYTEPSMEVDLGCVVCGGAGCRVCKGTGWLEIMGSGMVNPAVFEAVNARLGRVVYDPDTISGFAFGMGVERVAMVRYGITDIRLFYENDLRFLEQFER